MRTGNSEIEKPTLQLARNSWVICTGQGDSTINNIGSTSFGNQRNGGCMISKIPVNPV